MLQGTAAAKVKLDLLRQKQMLMQEQIDKQKVDWLHLSLCISLSIWVKSLRVSSLHLLKQLHWLPVKWRIKFKVVTLTFKALETSVPLYLAQQLHPYAPTRVLRSSTSKLLQVPCTNLRFGLCYFHVSAPTLWNSLPHSVRFCESLASFWKCLKLFIFNLHSLMLPSNPPPQRLRFSSWFRRFINSYTYLLTYLLSCLCVST